MSLPENLDSTPQFHAAIAEYLPVLLRAQGEDAAFVSALPELRLSEDEFLWVGSLVVDKAETISLYSHLFRGPSLKEGVSGFRDSQKPALDPLLSELTNGYMDIKQQQSSDDTKDLVLDGPVLEDFDYDSLSNFEKEVLDRLGLGPKKPPTPEEEINSDLAALDEIRSTALVELSHYVVRIPKKGAPVIENTVLSGEAMDRQPDLFPTWITSSYEGEALVKTWNDRLRKRISDTDRSYATEELSDIEKASLLASIREWANERRTTGPENPRVRYAAYLETLPLDPFNPDYLRFTALAKLGYPVDLIVIAPDELPPDYSSDPEAFRQWEKSVFTLFVKPNITSDDFVRFIAAPDYLDKSNYAFGNPDADHLLSIHPAKISYSVESGNCAYLYDWLLARRTGIGLEHHTKLPEGPDFDEFIEKAFITAFDRHREWMDSGYPAAGSGGYNWNIDEVKFAKLKKAYQEITEKGVTPFTYDDLLAFWIDYYQLFESLFPEVRQFKVANSSANMPNPYD